MKHLQSTFTSYIHISYLAKKKLRYKDLVQDPVSVYYPLCHSATLHYC